MNFLPYEKFTIQTNKSVATVESIMKDNVEPKLFIDTTLGPSISKDFYGVVGSDCFEIKPITWMRNSFVPSIKGKIKIGQVDIKMMLSRDIVAFIVAFSAFCLFFFVLCLLPGTVVESKSLIELHLNPNLFMTSIPIIMLIFSYSLTYVSFKYETKKSKKILIGMLGVYNTLSI
jgi:hypothetical protein